MVIRLYKYIFSEPGNIMIFMFSIHMIYMSDILKIDFLYVTLMAGWLNDTGPDTVSWMKIQFVTSSVNCLYDKMQSVTVGQTDPVHIRGDKHSHDQQVLTENTQQSGTD